MTDDDYLDDRPTVYSDVASKVAPTDKAAVGAAKDAGAIAAAAFAAIMQAPDGEINRAARVDLMEPARSAFLKTISGAVSKVAIGTGSQELAVRAGHIAAAAFYEAHAQQKEKPVFSGDLFRGPYFDTLADTIATSAAASIMQARSTQVGQASHQGMMSGSRGGEIIL